MKAPLNHKVHGDSAFFSRSEKATFEENPMKQTTKVNLEIHLDNENRPDSETP